MNDDKKIGERIRRLRVELLEIGSQQEFADRIGKVTRGAVGNWELGKGIKRDNLLRIAGAFGVSTEWLATGRGEPFADVHDFVRVPLDENTGEESNGDAAGGFTREHWRPKTPGAIPELDVSVGAGEGAVGEVIALPLGGGTVSAHLVVEEWPLPSNWLREVTNNPALTIIVPVRGESMVPNYLPGDRVVVDLSQDRFTVDSVYMISDGTGEPQIKRLQKLQLTLPPRVKIISDNPAYPDQDVELDLLKIHGRVCAYVGRR